MKYANLIRDFYKTTIWSLLFFAVTMTILPGDLYAQAESRYPYIPKEWQGGESCNIKNINKDIRITGVSFESGPYATAFFGQQPTYSQHSTNALRFAKLREYGRFGAVFSLKRDKLVPGPYESYTFDLSDIAPFIVSEGVVYRTKRTTVNGVRVPEAPLRIEHGYIPELPQRKEFTDKVMFLNGLSSKHKYRAGHRLWIPSGTFTDWKRSKKKNLDSAFMLAQQVCLVHYFPVDPSQIRSDGRVLLDKRWVQGYKDSDSRWRFIFVVAKPEGPKKSVDFYR